MPCCGSPVFRHPGLVRPNASGMVLRWAVFERGGAQLSEETFATVGEAEAFGRGFDHPVVAAVYVEP